MTRSLAITLIGLFAFVTTSRHGLSDEQPEALPVKIVEQGFGVDDNLYAKKADEVVPSNQEAKNFVLTLLPEAKFGVQWPNDPKERKSFLAVITSREDLALAFLPAKLATAVASQKDVESKMLSAIKCEGIDWKKQMVVIEYYTYPENTRVKPQTKFKSLSVQGKSLRIVTEPCKVNPNTTGARSWFIIAVVERVEGLTNTKFVTEKEE